MALCRSGAAWRDERPPWAAGPLRASDTAAMDEDWFETNGVRIFVRSTGPTDGPPVLLLHGLSGISATYLPVMAALEDRYRVRALDFRGHGQSARAPGTYELPYYAADVAAVLEHLGQPVVLAGHSLGGVVACHLVGSRPELVSAALLEDPPLYFNDVEIWETSIFRQIFPPMRDAMRRMQSEGASRDEVRTFLAQTPNPAGGVTGDHLTAEALEARVDAFLLCDPGVWDPAIEGGALGGWDPDTPIDRPVTLLRADPTMGPAFFAEHEERFRKAAPAAEVHEISGAPHGIHYFAAATDRYVDHLETLLARAAPVA
jgi:pimeloyl-ACP methyl ester carboxylesterase